jgi:hypothetical protein
VISIVLPLTPPIAIDDFWLDDHPDRLDKIDRLAARIEAINAQG